MTDRRANCDKCSTDVLKAALLLSCSRESCETTAGRLFAAERLRPYLSAARAHVQEWLRGIVNPPAVTICEFLSMPGCLGYNFIVKFCF